MRSAHVVEDVRTAERALLASLPPGTLMHRAAAGLAALCARMLGATYGARVLLLVGSGDNGGDALYAGARLAARGARVDALLLGSRTHEAGLAALRAAGGRVVDAVPPRLDLALDGIVGIGGRGGLRDDAAAAVEAVRGTGALVVAVDVPSGVDADTGQVDGHAVQADVTVTFGTHKPGLLVDPGAAHAGVVELVDIGLGPHLGPPAVEALQAADVAALLPAPRRTDDKYRRGVVGVAAGSDAYPGAGVLCAGAAVRSGAGMVRYVGDDTPVALVHAAWPEVVVGEGRVQAWTVGSGGGAGAAARLERAMKDGVPVVVDADALASYAERPAGSAAVLLTPHAGELARLLAADRADVEGRGLHHARAAADRFGATVLLKGATTLVVTPGRPVRVNPTGTPALATAGSGDVLAGLAGALLAGGLDPHDAGAVAAYVHGLAGRLASERHGGGGASPVSARDVLDALPEAVSRCRGVGAGWETGADVQS